MISSCSGSRVGCNSENVAGDTATATGASIRSSFTSDAPFQAHSHLSKKSKPKARAIPNPPSFVALPPSPIMISRAPRLAASSNISPTPKVFARRTSRSVFFSRRNPGRFAHFHHRAFVSTRRRKLPADCQTDHARGMSPTCHHARYRWLPPFPRRRPPWGQFRFPPS